VMGRARHKLGLADTEDIYQVSADRIEQHKHVLHRSPKRRRLEHGDDRWRPTERQLQIVRNRVSGLSAAESAQALGIERGTVNATMDQMKKRAGVKTFD